MYDIEQKDKQYVWHPFTPMQDWVEHPQLVITAGRGVKLIDSAGREYYDGVSSLWVNMHGHRKAAIDQAIIDQLGRVAHTTMLGLINVPATLLAERLVHIAPPGLDKVFYSDDGSTAVEVGIKMAFQYWQLKGRTDKKKFITLASAYHGDTLGTVSVGGIDLFHRIFHPLLFETMHAPSPCCYYCQLASDPATCGLACLAAMERMLAEHHDEVAAVVLEPLIQAAAGMLTQPAGYLRRVRELTRQFDVLLLVDEVATGFGRTGRMFACEHEGVSPDLMTISKGITAGYLPLAATLTTEEIYQAFCGPVTEHRTFFHGHSYTGNPLACAAALANLDVFEREQVIPGLQGKIVAVRQKLATFKELAHVGDVRQCGLMVGIDLVRQKEPRQYYDPVARLGHQVCMRARQYGLLIRPLGDVIVFMPPLASTVEDIATMLDIIYRCVTEVTEEQV